MVVRHILGALLLLGAAALEAQTKPAVTLAEAVERANLVQPRVVQALAAVQTADARIRAARGAWLPNLNFSTSAGTFYSEGQRVDPITGQLVTSNSTNTSINGNIQSSIEVFDGFRRSAESRAARANRASAEQGLEDARFQQELTTTNQFFDVLSAVQLVRVREASVRRAEEQLKVSIARLRAGAAIRSDSLRSLVTLGTARVALINAQTQLATAEANLGRLVGAQGPVTAVDDSSFYRMVPPIDTAALRSEALQRSPQVQAAEASARAARSAINVARSGYWPSVTVSGSQSLNGSGLTDYRFLQQRQASVQLSWNIFNRFTREQNIANQRAATESAEATAVDIRNQVQASLTGRLAELEAARVRIGIAQTSNAAATEDLRVQQERYRLGVATIVDVVTSQESLTQSEVDLVNARFDYLRAKAQIQALIGRQL
jgi:outer membrane protein TolC